MVATLREAGFSLQELGALPPRAWVELHGAVLARQMEWFATLMAALHPKSPQRQQRQFLKASYAAMALQETPIWQDPQRFKRMLMGVAGVAVEDRAKHGSPGSPPEPGHPPLQSDSGG